MVVIVPSSHIMSSLLLWSKSQVVLISKLYCMLKIVDYDHENRVYFFQSFVHNGCGGKIQRTDCTVWRSEGNLTFTSLDLLTGLVMP